MADVSKIKLPNNNTYNIKDYRIPGVDTTPTSGSDNVVTSGGIYNSIKDFESFYFVQGSSSAAGNATSGSYLSTKWEGTVPGVSTATNGLKIAYRIATNTGVSTAGVVLSIDGTNYYPVVIQKNTLVTSHYPVGTTVLMVFNSTQTATAYLTSNTKSTVTGCWQIMEYDSNSDTKQREYLSSDNVEYPITTRYATTSGSSYYAEYGRYSEGVTLNPSTNTITASAFKVDEGTSSQVLKADGSLGAIDSTPTANSSNLVTSGGVRDAIDTAIGSVYRVKGTKATYAELPSSGNVAGDVWNVTAAYGNYPAGTNWVWTGSAWDALGGAIDLSGKQDVLTFDSTPTANSTNPVTSGGIYDAISSNNIWERGLGTNSAQLKGNKTFVEVRTTDDLPPFALSGNANATTYDYQCPGDPSRYYPVNGFLSIDNGATYARVISYSSDSNAYRDGTVTVSSTLSSNSVSLVTPKYGTITSSCGDATGNNSFARGYISGGHITASGIGSRAEGYAEDNGNITASNQGSHAEGYAEVGSIISSGPGAHAEGYTLGGGTITASGTGSHAEGHNTTASGHASHAEGHITTASGDVSHAEGSDTTASGLYSHAEGAYTVASGRGSHAEGVEYNEIGTSARADAAHAEGAGVVVRGQAAHGEGLLNVAGRTQEAAVAALADFPNLSGTTEQKVSKLIGFASHSEGSSTQALGTSSHAEGNSTQALVNATHAEGDSTTASGESAHSEGYNTTASGNQSHSEGFNTQATANQAHSEGKKTIASAENAHSEGNETKAVGNASHSEGYRTYAYGAMSHIEGTSSTLVSDANAASESVESIWKENGHNFSLSRGQGSHVEGKNCLATGDWSHAEGVSSSATKIGSHAEGSNTTASGGVSHAEGYNTTASKDYSHTEGSGTIVSNNYEHAQGIYNKTNYITDSFGNAGNTLHSIGIGTYSTRKNAEEIMQNGDMYLIGVGSYDGTNYSTADTLQDVINSKQGSLTFDTTPTENSTNPVTSGGVYNALNDTELVVSAALNDLNDRVVDVEDKEWVTSEPYSQIDSVVRDTYTKSEIDTMLSNIGGGGSGSGSGGSVEQAVTSVTVSGSGNAVTNATFSNKALTLTKGNIATPGTLTTTSTTALSTASNEALSGSINLHKVSKTGNYNDLLNKPTIPTTLDQISDGSTRKLSDYIAKTGAVLEDGAQLSITDDETGEYLALLNAYGITAADIDDGGQIQTDAHTPALKIIQGSSNNPTAYAYYGISGIEIKNTGNNTIYTQSFPSKSGTLALTSDIPSAVTESTVSGWGFTKNAGTLTGVSFNGSSATVTNGVAAINATIPEDKIFVVEFTIEPGEEEGEFEVSTTTTFSEIAAAVQAGKFVVGTAASNILTLTDYEPGSFFLFNIFTSYSSNDDFYLSNGQIYVGSEDEVGLRWHDVFIPPAPGTLDTTATTAQSTSASEALSGNITLHKVAKTGTYSDLIGTPTIPTKVSDLTNDSGFTSNVGTITGITMNGASKGTSGVINLGTVITSETALSKGTTTGSGNAVTDISVNGHQITLTKGSTFLTSETSLSKGTTTGTGNVVTDLSVSGHTVTLTKGSNVPVATSANAGKIPMITSSGTWEYVTPAQIYSGSATPNNSNGNNGDIYVQM